MDLFNEIRCDARLVWIGSVTDRSRSLKSSPRQHARLCFAGIDDDSHGGLTRPACVRTEQLYMQETEIRNTRQITIVSREELNIIADEIGAGDLSPAYLGANLVVEGIPNFTLVPPSSRIQFASGATVTVDLINLPCNLPAREIEASMTGAGRGFKRAAANRRGVAGWVECEGEVTVGERLRLLVPAQDRWPSPA